MITQGMKIAIVGGGPGGLTLARLLQIKGVGVKVFERDAGRSVRQQGATLDLHEDAGLKAIREAGLLEKFQTHYRPGADKLRVVDQNAKIYWDDHAQEQNKTFGDEHFRPEIDRGPLRDLLIESLLPDTIIWNSQFISMIPHGEGWIMHFKNQEPVYADLVIGADGANSKIRPFVTDIQPIYSGITIVEGNIYNAEKNSPQLNALLKGGKVFALGNNSSIILSAKGEGSMSFYTGCMEDEHWVRDSAINFSDTRDVFAWFKQRFHDWNPIWQELFSSAQVDIVPRPMYHFPMEQHWESSSNVTLIGDAAHRMPPYAGEGVNMAMLDALALRDCLIDPEFKEVKTAITHYENNMRLRAAEITQVTLSQTEALHSPNALNNLIEMFQRN